MKKFVLFLILVVSMVATCFAYERGTCTIQNGNGATVIAEVSGGGHNVVYLNFYNDASSYVNVTVTVKVSNGGVTPYYTSGSQTFTVKPGKSSGEVKLTKVNWNIDAKNVTEVKVTGARCVQ